MRRRFIHMVYLLIMIAVLSGCKDKPVQKVILRPTPQIEAHRSAYQTPVVPTSKIDVAITERTVGASSRSSDRIDDIDTPVRMSTYEQARAIFGHTKPVAGAAISKDVHNTRAFLKSQPVRWMDVNYATQRMEKWENGKLLGIIPISGAMNCLTLPAGVQPKGDKTPHNHTGVFTVLTHQLKEYSEEHHVWMHHFMRFWGGHGIHDCHKGDEDKIGEPASNGCVRTLPEQNPWPWAKVGDIIFCHL
jgi:hypothetical protein